MYSPPVTGNLELDAYLYKLQLEGTSGEGSTTSFSDISGGTLGTSAVGYINRYLQVKYADDNVGTNLSNTPTNKAYFGFYNSASTTESTNPADYTWYKVTNGFSTNKYLWYVVIGGRLIQTYIGESAPNYLWVADSGSAIDLDVISTTDGKVARIAYAKATSYAIGSIPSTVETLTDISYPPFNTWGASETWQGTPPTLGEGEGLYISAGIYNPTTQVTVWNAPYLASLKVLSLSAISANLGSITAGSLNINDKFIVAKDGTTTIQSGTTGARTVITEEVIKVYDSTGTLRVRIGDLTA